MAEVGVGGHRVLVVEDNTAIARLLEELLTDEGHAVQCTGSGLEGLTILRTWEPHLVLLDMSLPGMDGDAFRAAQLEFGPPVSDIPVVLVTGSGNPEDFVERIGAVGLVRKPFDLDQLIDVVESALAPSRPGDARA